MELISKRKGTKFERFNEYFCEITVELDILAGINNDNFYLWKHYILADDSCIKEKCLAIRIPGGTVGAIWIDENNRITRIEVDTNYVVKTYPEDVNEQIQRFIGVKIEDI